MLIEITKLLAIGFFTLLCKECCAKFAPSTRGTAISFGQTNTDKEAIKSLLQKEADTWRSGDIEAHAACWTLRPYSRIIVSTQQGGAIDVPPEIMLKPPAAMVGQGGKAILSNFNMSINGDHAWVSHDEKSISKDGTANFSYEFRFLEKEAGEWKLVGQSIHPYIPKNQ